MMKSSYALGIVERRHIYSTISKVWDELEDADGDHGYVHYGIIILEAFRSGDECTSSLKK